MTKGPTVSVSIQTIAVVILEHLLLETPYALSEL